MRALFLAVAALALLAACGEKPQRLEVSSEQAATADQKQEPRRSRTAGQNEAARIYR
jgi:hypothetical protein